VPAFDGEMTEPTEDGRTGRVPASCVFSSEAEVHGFYTLPADRDNCSVGRWVHGFADLDDIADATDVAPLFRSGWINSEDVAAIETIPDRPEAIVYEPLDDCRSDPSSAGRSRSAW
jgi:hypothetical protein